MDGRFAVLEDLMKKMLEDKQKPTTSETVGGHGRGGNPNPFRGKENPEVEVLEGEDVMPPLEPLSREEMSLGYDRRGADFVGRGEESHRRGVEFEGRIGEYDDGFSKAISQPVNGGSNQIKERTSSGVGLAAERMRRVLARAWLRDESRARR
ncbi:hypothetical protein M5K25_027674 [Dendrobium thyrsiflorum]|uniref:Uncharacterized protein n=1 Tax=Dendrobium thyrsiflorum TaxID=117978 RepID=A0ABD0TUF4_DENTH